MATQSWIGDRQIGLGQSSLKRNSDWDVAFDEVCEVGTELLLKPDGTFEFGFAYGAADSATGTSPAVKVVDLSDGSRREFVLPNATATGASWHLQTDPAAVTRDEVAFPAGRISGTDRIQTVLRIDLTGLTPQPLP